MAGATALAKFHRILRESGPQAALGVAWKNLRLPLDRARHGATDLLFNVDTRGIVPLEELAIAAESREHGVWYEPTPWFALSTLLRRLACDFRRYDFVDFGCGKGRTLIEAARFPFREVTGVEFAPALSTIAKANLHRARLLRRRAEAVRVVTEDALHYDLPRNPCVLYFYNPFKEQMMRRLAERVAASYAGRPRDLIAIFYARCEDRSFRELNFLAEVGAGSMSGPLGGRRMEYRILRSHHALRPPA